MMMMFSAAVPFCVSIWCTNYLITASARARASLQHSIQFSLNRLRGLSVFLFYRSRVACANKARAFVQYPFPPTDRLIASRCAMRVQRARACAFGVHARGALGFIVDDTLLITQRARDA